MSKHIETGEPESVIERAAAFMRHDGLCGIVGGYGYCTCGMEAAEAELRALSHPTGGENDAG